mgnify:CR=1 FL=1
MKRRSGIGDLVTAAAAIAAASAALYGWTGYGRSSPASVPVRTPEQTSMNADRIAESKSGRVEKATFGAGCFWGVEAVFRKLPGVVATRVGYTGGSTQAPTYEDVCYRNTGHAEAVQVEFDPERISYAQLVDVFFANHNPTTLNRQGPDVGSQYRSVVFYHDDAQRIAAEAAKRALGESNRWGRPIVTQIVPAAEFHRAEEYHQQYLEKRGLSNCHL